MTALATPSVDTPTQSLSAQDFDLPCSRAPLGVPCGQSAEWWAQFEQHCKSPSGPATFDKLLCSQHHAEMVNGGSACCRHCLDPVRWIDGLLQLERIKP